MNNIYVETVPDNCWSCEFGYQEHSFEDLRCKFTGEYCNQFKNMCPLKPLSDRLAEERKKVCEFLREELNIRPNHPYVSLDLVSQENFFQNILDQIERGTDD